MRTDEQVTGAEFDADMMENLERAGLWIRVAAFDNGGETVDRYTVLIEADPPWGQDDQLGPETYTFLASPDPYWPQGVGMHGESWEVADSDVLIAFADLPEPVRRAVWDSAASHWMMPTPTGYCELNYDFAAQHWIPRFVERKD